MSLHNIAMPSHSPSPIAAASSYAAATSLALPRAMQKCRRRAAPSSAAPSETLSPTDIAARFA